MPSSRRQGRSATTPIRSPSPAETQARPTLRAPHPHGPLRPRPLGHPAAAASLGLLLCSLATAPVEARSGSKDQQLRRAASPLTPRSSHSISIRSLATGEELLAVNASKPRRIASVSKIFTVATAIKHLGADYRFATRFYADGVVGPSVGNIYIKGYGDPFLVSEEWHEIAVALPALEIRGDIIVDGSFFSDHLDIVREPGVPNPYNALNAAFATNFNTLEVTVESGRVSGEPQTPLTPFTVFDVQSTRRGPITVDQRQGEDALRIRLKGPFRGRPRTLRFHLGHDPRTPALYAGHIFSAIFARAGGVPNQGAVRRGAVAADAQLLYEHRSSRTLSVAASELFEYSNNFIANQVFLVLGAEQSGAPAAVGKSLQLLREDVERRVGSGQVTLHEGSGLDPRNKASASALTAYLTNLRADQPDLVDLLPERVDGLARAKTGTYKDFGVRAMAGYLVDDSGEPYASFALLCDHLRCAPRAYARFDQLLVDAAAVLKPAPGSQAPATPTTTGQ